MQPTPPPNQPGMPGGAPGQPRPAQGAPAAPTSAPAGGSMPQQQQPSKITHTAPGIGQPGGAATSAPAALARPSAPLSPNDSHAGIPSPAGSGAPAPPKITMFGRERQHEQAWGRTPNSTGTGAIHVKTFHCKLTEDALQYMDQTINEWLDSHPQYEVKFVSSSIGTMTGKLKEPALICQVWV